MNWSIINVLVLVLLIVKSFVHHPAELIDAQSMIPVAPALQTIKKIVSAIINEREFVLYLRVR